MKKKSIVVLLVALIICFGVCSCSGGEEITITSDNVNQYFEIKDVVEWEANEFDEVDNFWRGYSIYIKDEYAERLVANKTEISFEVKGTKHDVEMTVDFDNQTYKLSDVIVDSYEYSTTTSFSKNCFDLNAGKYTVTDSFDGYRGVEKAWNQDISNGDFLEADIVRAEGTLVLK